MDKNARRRLRRASTEKRLRYSVRKFSAGVASVAVAAFMFFGGNVVSADTLATADSSSTSTEKTTSVPDSGKNSRMDDSESAVGKDSTVTTVAESNAVSSATSTVSSTSAEDLSSKVEDKNVKSEATSQVSKASVATSQSTAATQSEALVSPATSATAESTAVSSEAAADETAAVEPKVSVEKAASQAASLATASKTPNEIARSKANSTLAAAQREVDKGYSGFRKAGESGFRSSASQTGKVTVTKENFLDYFKLNGSATYDKDNGIVTLTPDETSKGGNFSLNSKINMNQSFKLIGAVNLGDKTQAQGGADGIGFAFHTGNITDLGASGGNLGIGGLRNATGFKLDTYRNLYVPPKGGRFDTNDATFFEYGWAEDPNLGQFGSWVNTTFKKIKGQNGEYDRWWAETDAGSAQPLDSSDIDGKFHDFTIQYDGATKELTVTYRSNLGEKQWKKTVNSPEELMSMVVTASTGGNKNLQQFKIESFDFYQGASVGVRYEDEQGREIAEGSVTYPQGAFKGKTYTTEQKSIPNYDFVGLKNGSLPTSGSLTDWGNNGTVTYVYRQGKESVTDPAKLNSKVTRTIKYEYADGQTDGRPALKAPVTQEATFTRTGERNRVTGEETFTPWTPATKELAQEDTPVVTGFVADKANVAAKTVTPDDKDSEEVVQYKELGSYVPNVPDGLPKVPKLPYPNDPTDPTKPGTDLPLIPHVPGTTPVGPDGTTPLTPKDPNDPSKGYNPPPIPNDPTQDTPISYVTDKQKAITNFVTENGKVVSTPVVDEGDSGANFTKSKVDEVTKTIEKLEKAGYRVVKNDFPSKDTDRVFDKDKSVDQIFNVTVAERIIPVTPGKPVDPNDPNLPKNPDGTPVTPSTPEPGKPVFPNDPNSPVWPSTVKDLVTEKSATRTIKYVDRDGKEVSETRVETIKFTRDAKVNLVTGEITYVEWTTDRNDDIFNGYPVPVVKGYIAKAGDLESSTKDIKVTPDTIKDINETVVYDKLGSWVPNIPGTPTNPIPYPNDPKDPTKPGSDKPHVPYVPGFTPVDPNGNPLKPVDPNDPTKGYEVPNIPSDPTKDTPINYVPVPQPTPTPVQPAAPSTPQYMDGQRELPNTGTEDNASLAALGLLGVLSGFGLVARKKKED